MDPIARLFLVSDIQVKSSRIIMRPLLYVFSSLVLSGLTVAKPVQSFWYETITHNGISPFIPNGDSWTVFRNVKDYGAKGDGVTDDSAAIQSAINAGGKGSGGNGFGTTGAPAVVYFPSGTYAMGSAIQSFVDTVIMGNPISRPTLKALSNFSNSTIIYGKDPGFGPTINFYQGIKNLIIDSTAVSHNNTITLLDWSVSQATQLTNVLFNMPHNSLHTGVSTPEGGSGTYLGDLEFVGGKYGINLNNQQYSFKNIKFTGCNTGVYITHGFALVMQEMDFVDCETAVDSTSGGVGNVGSIALIDSTATSVGTVINTKSESGADDSIIIDNLSSTRSGATVKAGGTTILSGSVANRWVYGNAYTAVNASKHDAGTTYRYARPSALLSGKKYFTMAPPTYQDETHVVNIKSVSGLPVHGDGVRVSLSKDKFL
jgi:glucan 1,3-beta-glucosidase